VLCLELIDAGLLLAQQRGESIDVVGEGPGMAILGEGATLTGVEAAARVKLSPLLSHSNFWRGLSTEALTRPSKLVGTTADIAYAQLSALLEPRKSEGGVLLAIPAGYSREQLGLLLGVVNETGVTVAGLVDAALAACSNEPATARVLHLDLELHQALLSVLEYVGGEKPGLRRSRYEIAARQGVLALQQVWMQMIAENFVRKTRFDPLHDANMEQHLVDQLPAWLEHLRTQPVVQLQMQFGERPLQIELEREHFIAAAEKHYAALLKLVQDARVAGMPIELRVSQRVAAMPGLVERLSSLRDCELRVLPHGAAAFGALAYASAIARPAEALALVYQLPVPRAATAAFELVEQAATPAQLRPTHVLFQGRAWAISEYPLSVGWSVAGPARSLALPSASPGVSRSHCTLIRRNGSVMVEDHSTYGSFVNDERVVGSTALTVGDRLRLGAPGVTLELIQLVNDDGAPQD
jgi:hypothetical protein